VTEPRRPALPLALAVALGSGLGLSLVFPPVGAWPLAFVAIAPLFWVWRTAGTGRAVVLGLVFGIGCFGATLYWILRFGELAWVSLTLLSAASIAAVGLVAPAVIRPGRPLRTAVGVAAAWTVADWIRGMWPLGGFTWGSVGISQVDDPALLRLASITGVWGVTFVVVLVNALLLEATVGGGGGWRRLGRVSSSVALVLAPLVIAFPAANGSQVDVAAIQIDVRVPDGTSGTEEDLIVAARHADLHQDLAAEPPDLVLWGEGALDPAAAADPETMAAVTDTIATVGAPTVVGAVLNDADGSQHTSVLAFDGYGAQVDRYDKVHLVPFGEYVPWRDRLDRIEAIEQIPVDRVPGPEVRNLEVEGLPPFGTPVCFENAFPALFADFVHQGATFMVVPVNNASYGFTAASDQHLQMSRMRAVETGRWVVDAAVSGVSAFVDPSGRVTARTELFETAILRSRIWTSTAQTWYVRVGDWVPWLCVIVVMGLLLAPRRRPAARPSPGPLPLDPRALVILPTFDERDTVAEVIAGVLKTAGRVEVLVVDDSSPDGTADVVQGIAAGEPRVRLRSRSTKSGLASAYLEGFGVALDEGYDLIVEMDSDLSHDPKELGWLLAAATENDLTVGSRYVPGGSVTDWSRSRVALSRLGNLYARFMLGLPIDDATSGYRVYRRELLQALLERPIASDGYGFQVELVMRAYRLGYRVGEAPITFRDRAHGRSKISRRIVFEALWLVTRWGVALRLGREPVRAAGR
jgi:apolipoprotein N-acyltransferase